MKTNLYLSVACIATLFLASCSKETHSEPTSQLGEKSARLEIVLAGTKTVNGRATGGALPTSEDNIKTIAVGVFDNTTGVVNVIAEPTIASGTTLTSINCTPGTCDIIIVANAPTGTFAGVMNKNDFIAKTTSLSVTATSQVQASDNLPMSGEKTRVAMTAGGIVTERINLSRLVARISISSIKTDFDPNGSYANATFTPQHLFLYNAMSASTVVPTAQPQGTLPIHGGDGNATGCAVVTGNEYLFDAITSTANTPYTAPHWFYTFANDGATTPATATKFVISGTFDAGGSSPETVYYPIVVNKSQAGTIITGTGGGNSKIERNTEYKLTATIKGKGVPTPGENIDPATLTLTVDVADWVLTITQDVEFN